MTQTPEYALSPRDYEIIQTILKTHLPDTIHVWIFGSRLQKNAKPHADLDLAFEDRTGAPLTFSLLADLTDAFDDSDLAWRVDLVDLNAVNADFHAHIQSVKRPFPF